jgi:PAS domain S-box-containing protein
MQVKPNDSHPLAGQVDDVLDVLPEGFFALTADWRIAYVNRCAQQVFELDRRELPGRLLWETRFALNNPSFEAACRQAMRERAVVELASYDPVHRAWHEIRLAPSATGLFVYFCDVSEHVKTTLERRESEAHLRLMADSIPQIVWIVEADGRNVYFNRQWTDYTGVVFDLSTPANIAAEFVHPDDRAHTMLAWNAAYEGGGNYQVEHRIRSKSGGYRWFLVMAEPYRNAAGEIQRWFGTSTDIHEQKMGEMALSESELRFRALVNATSDVVYRMSPDWKYMHELDGRGFIKTTTSLGEYRIEDYVHPDDLELARTTIAAAIRDKAMLAVEHRVLRVDGTYGWTYSRAVPILDADGAIREWIGMASDITARKAIEAELVAASQSKDAFLAMLAHELRNPLAPIKAAAQLLQLQPASAARVHQTSQIIGRQVAHMTHLVDELLDVSRVSNNLIKLERVPLDVRDVLHDAVEQVTPMITARRQRLTIDTGAQPAFVSGDRKRLVQTVANLLGNAAKFTGPGGNIELRVGAGAGQIRIDIVDDGIGMTPETAAHAFELFAQAERSADRAAGGLGLGLALVKSLVELHGGTVACASAGLGTGSRFTVMLPRLSAPAPAGAHETRPARAEADQLRIMVVDDNRDAADTLAMMLEAMGHEVGVEYGARQALERTAAAPFQVCLLDIGLPEIDGFELARRLRARDGAGTMLVAVTGYGQDGDRARSAASGFDHHLVKPVDIDKLAAILSNR